MHEQNVRRFALVNQRKYGRITRVPTIPVELAVDFDRVHQQRQTSRSEHVLGTKLLAGEDLDLRGAHVRGGQEQLDRILLADALEVDALLDQLLQRIIV